jgi:hypothetical protein
VSLRKYPSYLATCCEKVHPCSSFDKPKQTFHHLISPRTKQQLLWYFDATCQIFFNFPAAISPDPVPIRFPKKLREVLKIVVEEVNSGRM